MSKRKTYSIMVLLAAAIMFPIYQLYDTISQVDSGSDYRFKSYDADLKRQIKKYYINSDHRIEWCYNITQEEVVEIYKQFEDDDITPFGKLLLAGTYNCTDSIRQRYFEFNDIPHIEPLLDKQELDSIVMKEIDSISVPSTMILQIKKEIQKEN